MSLETLAKLTSDIRANPDFRSQIASGAIEVEDAETRDALVAYARRLEQGVAIPASMARDPEAAYWYAPEP